MALVYYYSPMSSAVRTTWAIEELGLDCERRLIDLAAKGTREPWFLAKNPNGKVPVLEEDGRPPLFESGAVVLDVVCKLPGACNGPGARTAVVCDVLASCACSAA